VAGTHSSPGIESMKTWTTKQYDALERAILDGSRIAAYRRGTEFVVVPTRLRMISGREAVDATHPTTGDEITLYLDEMENFEVVR
jgi:hypothetical protein